MRILIVSATCKEIKGLRENFKLISKENIFLSEYMFNEKHIDILITGVGIASTAYRLGKILSLKKYDFAFDFGITGALKKNINIGAVVNVTSDIISELGAENGNTFLKFDELGMSEMTMERTVYFTKNKNEINIPEISILPVVKGITVNTVNGNNETISNVVKRFLPDVESMEGAAFLYACEQENIKCAQVRAVSNYVEERNIKNWNIDLAIKNLNDVALKILNALC